MKKQYVLTIIFNGEDVVTVGPFDSEDKLNAWMKRHDIIDEYVSLGNGIVDISELKCPDDFLEEAEEIVGDGR